MALYLKTTDRKIYSYLKKAGFVNIKGKLIYKPDEDILFDCLYEYFKNGYKFLLFIFTSYDDDLINLIRYTFHLEPTLYKPLRYYVDINTYKKFYNFYHNTTGDGGNFDKFYTEVEKEYNLNLEILE